MEESTVKPKRVKIGFELDEVIRSKYTAFDAAYYKEFDRDGWVDKDKTNPYTLDLRNDYIWEDKVEIINVMKDDIPDDIPTEEYYVDEDGTSPADSKLFDVETNTISADEVYNRFMYVDYVLEIFGFTTLMYKNQNIDFDKLSKSLSLYAEMSIVSIENASTIPATLNFLSTRSIKTKKIFFCNNDSEIWEDIDILVTTNPKRYENMPANKKMVLLSRPYNADYPYDDGINAVHIDGLINNAKFNSMVEEVFEQINKKDN